MLRCRSGTLRISLVRNAEIAANLISYDRAGQHSGPCRRQFNRQRDALDQPANALDGVTLGGKIEGWEDARARSANKRAALDCAASSCRRRVPAGDR